MISRSFHYWQPAPRWRPLPWLANPGKPAMSPHTEGEDRDMSLGGTVEKREGNWGNSLEDKLQCKTMLTENAKTCLSPRAHGILAHAHVGTPLTTRKC